MNSSKKLFEKTKSILKINSMPLSSQDSTKSVEKNNDKEYRPYDDFLQELTNLSNKKNVQITGKSYETSFPVIAEQNNDCRPYDEFIQDLESLDYQNNVCITQ